MGKTCNILANRISSLISYCLPMTYERGYTSGKRVTVKSGSGVRIPLFPLKASLFEVECN